MARALILGLLGLGLLVTPLGCSPPPPDAEALLWYFRNVPIHGEVRRVWPAGQAYVDDVLAVHAELAAKIAALEEAVRVTAVWPVGDPRWDDNADADAHHRELVDLGEGDTRKRALLVDDLKQAIGKLPDGLDFASATEREAYEAALLRSLAPPFKPFDELLPELETLVIDRARLVGERVSEDYAAASFAMQHAALVQRLSARRDAWIRFAEQRLTEIDQRLGEIDKRKQRDEYSTLFWERDYLVDRLRDYPKRVYALLSEARNELEELQDTQLSDANAMVRQQARMEYLTQRVAALEPEHAQLKQRIDEIMKPYEDE